ncbi:uncharacterized protein [Antedon mediterranea]|uniref:uncharacterized protein n=1 Tax=Antedon mediterranea TaxID=105859 RepID=UPI003AF75547
MRYRMDVEQGLCWRCEDEKTEEGKKCSRCNIAEYCGEQCREQDKLRHQVECDMWNRNGQCFACVKKTDCKWCTHCREVSYCSQKCQRDDWKHHKIICERIQDYFQMMVFDYRQRMMTKLIRLTNIHVYFNPTIAIDVLKLKINEASVIASTYFTSPLSKDYNVLFGDVGDLGSVLLTTASLPKDFTGNVMYTLAAISPFVMARNVLFIYMMLTQNSRDDIEETVTNIWYSLQLPDEDFDFLVSMLKELVDHDADTLKVKTSGELLLNQEDLSKIKEIWKKWLELECDTSKSNSIDLVGQRTTLFSNGIWCSNSQDASDYCQKVPEKHLESVSQYYNDGLFLKDDCLGTLRFENPTLTGPPLLSSRNHQRSPMATCNFEYCIPPLHNPFRGWDYIQASKMFKNEYSIVKLFYGYITNVVRNAITFIKKHRISFNCCVGDFTLLYKQSDVKPTYDRITASQAVDVTGFKQILSSMRPLLSTTNKHAVLLMETHGWIQFIPEADVNHPVNRERADKVLEVVKSETGCQELKKLPLYPKCEYFDNTSLFIRFLRAVFSGTTNPNLGHGVVEPIPRFPFTGKRLEGFKLRDFTKGLNKVIPFQYRQNARLCNIFPAYPRNLEWHF